MDKARCLAARRIIRRIGDFVREREADFSRMVAQELGRPAKHVAGEVALSADQFEWFAEETKRIYGQTIESRQAGGRIVISHEPVGVVAAFTAWNFPLVLLARKIAPALAAGCSIICRPSEETPGSAMLLVKCCHDAGVPPGLVNLVLGKADEIAAIVMASPIVRKISLTGSISVGKNCSGKVPRRSNGCRWSSAGMPRSSFAPMQMRERPPS